MGTDSSGKRWCYLKDVQNLIGTHRSWNSWTTVQAASPVSTTCRDGRTSQQFQGKVYGYHACGTPELNSYECQRLLNGGGGGNNNCGSWNNYCNGNNVGGNNNCGSWNNYCNGNNNNNNCGSWNNYCRNKNSGGPLQQLLGQLNGGNAGRNRLTSTRNQ